MRQTLLLTCSLFVTPCFAVVKQECPIDIKNIQGSISACQNNSEARVVDAFVFVRPKIHQQNGQVYFSQAQVRGNLVAQKIAKTIPDAKAEIIPQYNRSDSASLVLYRDGYDQKWSVSMSAGSSFHKDYPNDPFSTLNVGVDHKLPPWRGKSLYGGLRVFQFAQDDIRDVHGGYASLGVKSRLSGRVYSKANLLIGGLTDSRNVLIDAGLEGSLVWQKSRVELGLVGVVTPNIRSGLLQMGVLL